MRSFFVAADIDVNDLLERLPPHWSSRPGKHSALLTLHAEDRTPPDADTSTVDSADTHVSVYRRGAMVFVNCDFATYLEVFNLVKSANTSAVRPEFGEGTPRCVVQRATQLPLVPRAHVCVVCRVVCDACDACDCDACDGYDAWVLLRGSLCGSLLECAVEVDPTFETWSKMQGEKLRIQSLDYDNIAIINSVLAQVSCRS